MVRRGRQLTMMANRSAVTSRLLLQLAVVRQDQQLMVGEMRRWKALLGSFAALAGGSGRAPLGPGGSDPASELASGWQPVSPAELMMEASNAPALRGTMEGESVQRSGIPDPPHAVIRDHRRAAEVADDDLHAS